MLGALSGMQWFTTSDLKSGYWQIKIAEEDKLKMPFVMCQGLYQFKVIARNQNACWCAGFQCCQLRRCQSSTSLAIIKEMLMVFPIGKVYLAHVVSRKTAPSAGPHFPHTRFQLRMDGRLATLHLKWQLGHAMWLPLHWSRMQWPGANGDGQLACIAIPRPPLPIS